MKIALPILGVLLVLVGSVFSLQGAGILLGSSMTGVTFWLGVGVILIGVGIALITYGVRARRKV
ncbi:MAG: hypothetical protein ABI947_01955 [Chloroflexota bacterium]